MKPVEPSNHIYLAAKQFFEAVVAIRQASEGRPDDYVYPRIVNFTLACELALKAIDASVETKATGSGELLHDSEIKSELWGHKLLSQLFNKLQPASKFTLICHYKNYTGTDLEPSLKKCEDYFVKARYPWNNDSTVFAITEVEILAEGLLRAVVSFGGKSA